LSRDWWRISKCLERIKVVNLGGSAIGTSVTVPVFFVSEVVSVLQDITGLPVTRGENLSDATSNLDPFVEVHGILKAHAVNLEKISGDVRSLSSDLHGDDVEIPQLQAGSSIMPGKVNPVIPEFVISSAHRIYSNDMLITGLSAQGCLELNAYIPVTGIALIESLTLLKACNTSLTDNLFSGLKVHAGASEKRVMKSPVIATVLLPYVGYNKASELAEYMKKHNTDIIRANEKLNILPESKLKEALQPEKIVQGGYRLKDME
jgi:aspartate ammonia-lyase